MIPRTLENWSKESLLDLLGKHYFEPETFDYKETFPHKGDDRGKQRLRKAICAFANSSGGFLVFGVKDDATLAALDRLVGFDPKDDFPQHFGTYAAECRPTVTWDYKKPAIVLDDGNLIHVVEIPRSWRAPHAVGTPAEGLIFTKRTNAGDESMSYEEVRMSFLGYYEKRLKLQLLRSEIRRIHGTAETLFLEGQKTSTAVNLCTFSLAVLEAVLADAYVILCECPNLLTAIEGIRNLAVVVNNAQQAFLPMHNLELPNKEDKTRKHNCDVGMWASEIVKLCQTAEPLLGQLLAK
jgi:hypothetical protein